MDRNKFKNEFKKELVFFSMISNVDLEKGFTVQQVEDELVKFSSSFYGARLDFDVFAVKKAYFIATYAYQIIKGNIDEDEINYLCDEIEEEVKLEKKHSL